MTAVPKQYIKQHLKPEEKLNQLRQIAKLDSLQKLLLQFTTFLEDLTNLSSEFFGVTGSLLLDIHQPAFSDLDITVYGMGNSWKLKKALTENLDIEMPMHRLTGTALRKWATKKAENYPLTPPEALKVYSRKWNLGTFGDRWASIHPVKLENEITDEYGRKSYQPIGQVTLRATVYDDIDSIFLPAVYKIKNTEILNGPSYEDVNEVVTYESLYDSLAENGETIQASGKLEQVTEKESNRKHHRLVVGSTEGKGREYIKLVD